MQSEKFKVIYEDENVLVVDKPAGIVVFPENKTTKKTLIDYLSEEFLNLKKVGTPPRYGIIHRLDKDTSGILLVAKSNEAFDFFQKEFKNQRVNKKYIALVIGRVKENQGTIKTFIGRSKKDRRKQKVYLVGEPKSKGKREAITEYRVLERFKDYTLVEIFPKTGRKHQIRCHFTYLSHPLAGDKLYGFKGQISPKNLKRQFLHASYLKIKLPDSQEKEFKSELAKDLKEVLNNLKR